MPSPFCIADCLLVAFAAGANLSLERTVEAKDFSLAEAAEPSLGRVGIILTEGLALMAPASGLIARAQDGLRQSPAPEALDKCGNLHEMHIGKVPRRTAGGEGFEIKAHVLTIDVHRPLAGVLGHAV